MNLLVATVVDNLGWVCSPFVPNDTYKKLIIQGPEGDAMAVEEGALVPLSFMNRALSKYLAPAHDLLANLSSPDPYLRNSPFIPRIHSPAVCINFPYDYYAPKEFRDYPPQFKLKYSQRRLVPCPIQHAIAQDEDDAFAAEVMERTTTTTKKKRRRKELQSDRWDEKAALKLDALDEEAEKAKAKAKAAAMKTTVAKYKAIVETIEEVERAVVQLKKEKDAKDRKWKAMANERSRARDEILMRLRRVEDKYAEKKRLRRMKEKEMMKKKEELEEVRAELRKQQEELEEIPSQQGKDRFTELRVKEISLRTTMMAEEVTALIADSPNEEKLKAIKEELDAFDEIDLERKRANNKRSADFEKQMARLQLNLQQLEEEKEDLEEKVKGAGGGGGSRRITRQTQTQIQTQTQTQTRTITTQTVIVLDSDSESD
jgi:hypothetical protein